MRNILRNFLWRWFFKNIIRYFVGISYGSNDSLRNTPQFIIVGNHNSHLDTAVILSALPSALLPNVYTVAAGDYFGRNKVIKFATEFFLNATLIKRHKDGDGPNPIEQLDGFLKEGKSLVIYPEGTRGNPNELQKFKKGVGILLEKNPHIPVIPVFLDGLGRTLPKGEKLLVPFNGSIQIGEPLLKKPEMNVDETIEYIQQAVINLAPKKG